MVMPTPGMAGGAPVMPGTPAGPPPGPGASPVLSPGGGAGNQAAALASLKAIVPLCHKVLSALPVGGKEYKAVHRILGELNTLFSGDGGASEGLVPAAIQQMALAAKSGGMPKPPAPGLAAAPPPGASSPPEAEAA